MLDPNTLPTVVSFYTRTWRYEEYARLMVQSCDRLGLKHAIRHVDSNDIWFNVTRYKPRFLLDIIQEVKGPILWIDADGCIYKRPHLFTLPCEYDLMMKRKPKSHSRTWHVGTMFINYNDKTLDFLSRWVERVDATPGASDELCLDHMWKDGSMSALRIADDLPSTYFYMPPDGWPMYNTVILHRESRTPNKNLR